ncbi:MAG: VCBS repeat-containing protein [Deltaproteobacteria bacterium]|nr:VCBS repeat-containing protein [Deltaproteobacteria bacterium]
MNAYMSSARHPLCPGVALAAVVALGCSGEPKIAGVTPPSGSARGGTPVAIDGSGFGDSPRVSFGAWPAAVLAAADDHIEAITPRALAGAVDVTVSAGDASTALPAAFTYLPLPLRLVDIAPARLAPEAYEGRGACTVDADGDGDPDIVQAVGPEGARLYLNGGAGTFAASVALSDEPATGEGWSDAVAADFDGDGRLDLLAVAPAQGASRLLRGDGAGGFEDATEESLPEDLPGLRAAVALDVDADGDADVVAALAPAEASPAPGALLLLNDGAGELADESAPRLPPQKLRASGLGAGDLDGDGRVDLLLSGDGERSQLWLGDGQGAFKLAPPDAFPTEVVPGAGAPALGDLDGDGALDVYLPAEGRDRVYRNDGSGRFFDLTDAMLGDSGGFGAAATVADLDLDGHADVLVARRDRPLGLFRNDGAGRLFDYSAEIVPSRAQAAAGLALGDVDADGDLDVFVSRSRGEEPALLLLWDPAAAGDGDGDGVPDAADNCPAVANADQANRDSHHFGCASATACASDPGCELALRTGAAYLLCRDRKSSWAAARDFCRARGAALALPRDDAQSEALAGMGTDGYWIGVSDAAAEGTWTGGDGEKASYTNWADGEPGGGDAEDCAMLVGGGKWNDAACETEQPFVCQDVRSRTPDPGDACDRCPERNDPGDEPIDPQEGGGGAPACAPQEEGQGP